MTTKNEEARALTQAEREGLERLAERIERARADIPLFIDPLAAKAIRIAIAAPPQVSEGIYGCHCDLEPGMEADGCVIDEGRPNDCVYAKRLTRKEDCSYWRPIIFKAKGVSL